MNRNMISMLLMVILVGMGEKLAERFLPLYLLTVGGTAQTVGLLNAMDIMLGALYSFPGGWLSDKIGFKNSLITFTLIAMAGFAIVIVIPTYQAVLAGSVLFISWTAVSLPAIMSLVNASVPKNRRTFGVSLHSLVRRIPMAAGPVAGGALISLYGLKNGVRAGFAVAFLLAGISVLILYFFVKDNQKRSSDTQKLRSAVSSIRGNLKNLLISDILIRFAEQIPYAFVVIWCVKIQKITELQFGFLTALEMAVAMIVYIPVAYLADHYGKKPFVLMTFGFFTLFPLVLLFSKNYAALAVAFIIRGLKEFGEPTRKALIMDLAPEDSKASVFGAYYLIRDAVVSVAALFSAFLWNISPTANFLTAFFCGLTGMIWFYFSGNDQQNLSD